MPKMSKISVCLPIHDEERYLPYSFRSLKECPIDELVVLFDRCSDRSEAIFDKVHFPFKTTVLHKSDQKWRCPTAEVFEILFSQAQGDIIFDMAGDIVPDPAMFSALHFLDSDIVSFMYLNRDLLAHRFHQYYIDFHKKYINIAKLWKGPLAWRTGLFGCKREVWEENHFRDVPSEYDDFLERSVFQHGRIYKFVKSTKNLHLRVGLSKSRQSLQGMSRAQRGDHPLKALGHSMLLFKPWVFTYYLQERKYQLYKTQKWSKEGYDRPEKASN